MNIQISQMKCYNSLHRLHELIELYIKHGNKILITELIRQNLHRKKLPIICSMKNEHTFEFDYERFKNFS